ncbi:quinone-dependent dihydroorotate dehydrogenase [Elstera sp.]|jgi:dihydroorotate dehydrogenase|uniref:quinone-dependent dihydroorotate dehydrogenase n=1 Tax=Elstera sp. TaxID=1916664 RepID=UPI0037C0DF97
MIDLFPLARPFLHRMDPEEAHGLTLKLLAAGMVPQVPIPPLPRLATHIIGRDLPHPLGLSAGFDKNARAFHQFPRLGVSFGEIGGVTPLPQIGNPRPRLFRLSADQAIINRMGFNNEGMAAVAARFAARKTPGQIVGVNLASNADSADPANDFVLLARAFAPQADFLTLDISCPNTANGKMFLSPGPLRDLLDRLAALFATPGLKRPPLVAKIAPDIDEAGLDAVLEVLLEKGIDALTLSNTTLARPDTLRSSEKNERGGLSGPPLFAASTDILRKVFCRTRGCLPLIGVGGISSGADAYAKIKAGASALQLYTALVYQGPWAVRRILVELDQLLAHDGHARLVEAVGVEA